jgi:hypothetical protein
VSLTNLLLEKLFIVRMQGDVERNSALVSVFPLNRPKSYNAFNVDEQICPLWGEVFTTQSSSPGGHIGTFAERVAFRVVTRAINGAAVRAADRRPPPSHLPKALILKASLLKAPTHSPFNSAVLTICSIRYLTRRALIRVIKHTPVSQEQ